MKVQIYQLSKAKKISSVLFLFLYNVYNVPASFPPSILNLQKSGLKISGKLLSPHVNSSSPWALFNL